MLMMHGAHIKITAQFSHSCGYDRRFSVNDLVTSRLSVIRKCIPWIMNHWKHISYDI